jgi:hypothetical protein
MGRLAPLKVGRATRARRASKASALMLTREDLPTRLFREKQGSVTPVSRPMALAGPSRGPLRLQRPLR